jgi:tetratricopeptide (TPR) repeat protein
VSDPGRKLAQARELCAYGAKLRDEGNHTEARDAFEDATTILRELMTADPMYEHSLALALDGYTDVLTDLGRWHDALPTATECAVLYRRLTQADPARHEVALASALLTLGTVLSNLGLHEAALPRAAEAVVIFDRRVAAEPATVPLRSDAVRAMIRALEALGRRQEAANLRAQLDP